MELIYIVTFVLFAVPAAVLEYTENACFGLWERKTAAAHAQNGGYLQFRNNYVLIFSLMMGEMRGTSRMPPLYAVQQAKLATVSSASSGCHTWGMCRTQLPAQSTSSDEVN